MRADEGKSVPLLKEFQVESMLAPVTPVKPMVPGQRPIYPSRQEALTSHQDCLAETEDYLSRFTQQNQAEMPTVSTKAGSSMYRETRFASEADQAEGWTPAHKPPTQLSESTSSNNPVHGDLLFTSSKSIMDEKVGAPKVKDTDPLAQWSGLKFSDLLAMNNGIATTIADNQAAPTSNSFLSNLGSQCENTSARPTALMFENQDIMGDTPSILRGSDRHEQDMLKQLNQRTGIQQSDFFRNCWNSYDLNSHPNAETALPNGNRHANISNAFSDGFIPMFAPATPDYCKRLEKNVDSEKTSFSVGNHPNKQNAEGNQISVPRIDDLLGNKETQSATESIAIESYNADKGGNHDLDLNKTIQQKPRRKKHRPKVISEDKHKQTPKQRNPKPNNVNETPRQKRKYVRKSKTNTPSTTPQKSGTEAIDSKRSDPAVKSCRKALNFDLEDQVKENNFSHGAFNIPPSEQLPQHLHPREGKDVIIEATQEFNSYDICSRNNQIPEDYMPEREAQSILHSTKATPSQYESNAPTEYESPGKRDNQTATSPAKGKTAKKMHPTNFFTHCPNASTCASSIEGKHMRGLKRANSSSAEVSNMERQNVTTNSTPSQVNHMLLGNAILSGTHGMYFPEIYKKRRTEKMLKPNTLPILSCANALENIKATTTSQNYPSEAAKASKYYYSTPAPHFNISAEPNNQASAVCSHQHKAQFMNWGDIDKLKKKRSKAPTRVRDLDSLKGLAECREKSRTTAKQRVKGTQKKNVEAFKNTSSMETLSIASDKKRAGKRKSRKPSTGAKSITSSFDIVDKHSLDFYGDQQFTGISKGPFLALPWIDTIYVDAITEGMKQLNINREGSIVQYQEQALVHFHVQDQQNNALVLYQRDGIMVPFAGTQTSKRRSRAKVDLDDETNRVWKLLLEDINNQGIDGTDEEKARWWEEERKVFHGRVDSFIARMRLVQGDRRFSPWKGSVVDSVVGVFLTQNVSDHLSSSAFMSLAARFPLKSADKVRTYSEEEVGPLVEEPEICIVDLDDNSDSLAWNEKTVEGPICDRNSRILHDIDVSEEKEAVNSKESHGSTNLKDDTWRLFHSSQEKPLESQLYRASSINKESEMPTASEDVRTIDDTSSQYSVISSQNSAESPSAPTSGKMGQTSDNISEGEDLTTSSNPSSLHCSASFVELLKMAETPMVHAAYATKDQAPSYRSDLPNQEVIKEDKPLQKALRTEMLDTFLNVQNKCSTIYHLHPVKEYHLHSVDEESRSVNLTRLSENFNTKQSTATTESTGEFLLQEKALKSKERPSSSSDNVCSYYVLEGEEMVIQSRRQPAGEQQDITNSQTERPDISPQRNPKLPNLSRETVVTESTCASNSTQYTELTATLPLADHKHTPSETHNVLKKNTAKQKTGRTPKKASYDWDNLRKQAQANGKTRQRTANTMDSLDWEAVRCANVKEVADTIKERGMNNVLAERIKEFLDRLVNEHGSIDLEWLRDVPPDKAKEYLLSIRGLGLKSVECVRLLTLHHLAFPVDTNVGRIAVRLGWVPLQPLPESLQLHLLELYPVLESIQKYLWPRLCKLDQRTLYELHYHMITFGKVFCTKKQPNCNACPLRGECRHFASAFASARLALPGPEDRSIVPSDQSNVTHQDPQATIKSLPMPLPMADLMSETKSDARNCEPIIEIPASPEPEPEQIQASEYDIEDALNEDPNEIPTIKLNLEEFTQTLQTYMQANMELQEGDMSKALVALAAEAASIPTPKLKNVSRLRTEHHVYELPDTHQLLRGLDKREPDDPCPYLLAIWSPGETANSIEPPEKRCNSQEPGELCSDDTCLHCNSQREANAQIVRATLLIPCRTAMRGSFPLNGTYFQVNEVFADHDSSLNPIEVPRSLIWNLPRRTVYFGTSIPTIFKGLSTEGIQHCFWRGYVCVRGFDQKTRAPRPLTARLHFPASRMARPRGKSAEQDN